MINTKALTIRFGYSRFWRVKIVPTNFYDNYHYIFLNNYIQDFFSQKIFHLVGFVYGHSVIKYSANFIKAEVFVHDFRLEEFLKAFFKFSKRNSRRRILFRRRFFRPFFKKFFFGSRFPKIKGKFYSSSYHKKKFALNGRASFKRYDKRNLNYKDNVSPSAIHSFDKRSKRHFCNFRPKFSKNRSSLINTNKKYNFKKNYKNKFKINSKFNRKNKFLKISFKLFSKFRKYILKIRHYIAKFSAFQVSKSFFCKLNSLQKKLFEILKFFNFFILIYKRFIKTRFSSSFMYSSSFFKLNRVSQVFLTYKRFTKYSRYNTFSNYSFLPYSKKFMFKHLPKRLSKADLLETKFYRFNDFSTYFSNVKYRSYYPSFVSFFKKKIIFKKIFKFKNFFKLFFPNYFFSPFVNNFVLPGAYITADPVHFCSTSKPRHFLRRFKFKGKLVKSGLRKKAFFNRYKFSTNKNFLFRFLKKKRKKKIRRTFLPFFPRFKIISYNYFKFFRFKFFKFVCSLFSRSLNVQFLGLPVKLFIRVVPAYRTTVNMFLRYFITRLFYRYMLGDIINPIVRTSMKRFRGFTAVANGRFTRAQIASHKQYKRGSVSFSSISIPIDYNQMFVPLKYGTCNLKLWIRY